jgi:hypothetical protein
MRTSPTLTAARTVNRPAGSIDASVVDQVVDRHGAEKGVGGRTKGEQVCVADGLYHLAPVGAHQRTDDAVEALEHGEVLIAGLR